MTNMSNTPAPLPEEDMSHLDADLRSLVAGLDALGAADCAAPNAAFEDRLMQSTLAALHGVEPVAASAAELGAIDRAAAPSNLEDTVYAESVPALREGVAATTPALRHVGEPDRSPRRHARPAQRPWWANQYVRLAATMVLVAGVGIMVRGVWTPKTTATDIGGDMELLFAAMESKPAASTPTDSPAMDQETDDLTKWLIEGASS